MNDYGPIYRLAAGPRNFVVVSDPAIAKHVLRNYGTYAKGLVSEVSEFLFGSGFAIAEGPLWTVLFSLTVLFMNEDKFGIHHRMLRFYFQILSVNLRLNYDSGMRFNFKQQRV